MVYAVNIKFFMIVLKNLKRLRGYYYQQGYQKYYLAHEQMTLKSSSILHLITTFLFIGIQDS